MSDKQWAGSAQAWQRAKGSLGGGVSSGLRAAMKPHPLFFDRGQGSRLWDVDGNSYLDYVLGWGPVILGHSHPKLVAAVSEQLPLGQTFGAGHRREYEVAERVCSVVPGVERVLWSNSGSEADQMALRLARAVTGRTRFVKFAGHYHGWSDPFLVGYRPGPDGSLGLTTRGQHERSVDDAIVTPWNDLERVREVLTDPANDVAAVYCEPVLCNSGVLAPADGFLAGLRELCDRTGTVLVFDEVITGFRMAYGGAIERYGVVPDLVVWAKAIAGGFSLAAVGGRGALIDEVTRGVVHAGSYNGNPIVLAAAQATLDVLGGDGVYQTFETLAGQLANGFAEAFARHGVPGTAHHVGPVIQCVPGVGSATTFDDYLAADWDWYDALSVELLRRGVFVLPGGRWYLSTAHTSADIDETVAAFDAAVHACKER